MRCFCLQKHIYNFKYGYYLQSPVAVKLEEHSELLIDTSFEEDDDNDDEDIPIDDSDLDETYSPVKLEDNVIVHMKVLK